MRKAESVYGKLRYAENCKFGEPIYIQKCGLEIHSKSHTHFALD